MGRHHLAVLVLQQVAERAVQYAGTAARDGRRMGPAVEATPRGLHPDQTDRVVVEGREDPDGVAATTDAGHHRRGQAPGLGEHLGPGLAPDHRLKLAHHQRVGMRTDRRSDHIVRAAHVGYPVADRLVGRVLQRLTAALHRRHGGAEQLHLVDIDRLACHVVDAHEDLTLEPEFRAHGGDRDAVLTRTGLGNDPLLSHPAGE